MYQIPYRKLLRLFPALRRITQIFTGRLKILLCENFSSSLYLHTYLLIFPLLLQLIRRGSLIDFNYHFRVQTEKQMVTLTLLVKAGWINNFYS